ncbi:MAG: molybdopterin-dependent oxidoreductase [Eubacteriales bacterium]|nr:molybdopterin-dependent oxidoreductase [Eubacteriales bacterium]MDD3537662.1 molybdopterin-dependent oxidoreductase [Eubacteriales bacterium]
MKINQASKICHLHLLRTFFEDLDQWKLLSPVYGINSQITRQAYDDLFKGTDADIYIPLWASACKGKGDILLDDTTLSVIKFYKKYGYRPVRMDGNPADFIGEQLRFLEYLAVIRSGPEGERQEPAEEFIDAFTVDTIKELCKATEATTKLEEVRYICDRLKDLIHGTLDNIQGAEEISHTFDSATWTKQPEIPVEEARIVRTAGINNCGGNCKLQTVVQEGCILYMDSAVKEPEDQLHLRACPRGRGYRHTFLNARRLRYPMKRRADRGAGKFQRITWKQAEKEIADKMAETMERYGPASRYVIYGTGTCTVTRADHCIKRLLNLQGGYLAHYNSYSSACSNYITPYVLGDLRSAGHVSDVLNSKLIILWGHNTAETIIGPFRNYYLMKAKEAGVRIIVIDPRQSETAISMADQWVPIKPGGDTALANAMAYVIYQKGLQDQAFMDRFCIGFDEEHLPEGVPVGESYHSYLFGKKDGVEKTPAWAEKICGVPADVIESLAVAYATTKPACILPGLGVQRTSGGENAIRATIALCAMTGNVGIPGGGASGTVTPQGHEEPPEIYKPENPFKGLIPAFMWSKAIDSPETMTPREDGLKNMEKMPTGIKLLFSLASNVLINQHSNINSSKRILSDTSKCELIVLSDLFMTPSARWADLVLPAPSLFENATIPNVWATDDYILYCDKATDPLFGSLFEYNWIKEVARHLGLYEAFTQGHEDSDGWARTCYEDLRTRETELPEWEVFKEKGGYMYQGNECIVPFRENIEKGIPFATPSGKIEIFSKQLFDLENPEEIGGVPIHFRTVEGPEDPLRAKYPLQMVGYHTKRRTHSIHDQNPLMEELDPPAIWIHPVDANKRSIRDGELVEVFNDRGIVRIPAKVTNRIMEGVCAMSQGGWYTPDENGVDVRGSINVLTLTHKPTPVAKGNPQHSNLVDIRKCTSQ